MNYADGKADCLQLYYAIRKTGDTIGLYSVITTHTKVLNTFFHLAISATLRSYVNEDFWQCRLWCGSHHYQY